MRRVDVIADLLLEGLRDAQAKTQAAPPRAADRARGVARRVVAAVRKYAAADGWAPLPEVIGCVERDGYEKSQAEAAIIRLSADAVEVDEKGERIRVRS